MTDGTGTTAHDVRRSTLNVFQKNKTQTISAQEINQKIYTNMNKIEQLKAELTQGIALQVILAGITATSIYCLAMSWVNQSFLGFIVSGIFTGCIGWLTIMQSLSVLHTWQKVGREQIRQDLEEASRRYDVKF